MIAYRILAWCVFRWPGEAADKIVAQYQNPGFASKSHITEIYKTGPYVVLYSYATDSSSQSALVQLAAITRHVIRNGISIVPSNDIPETNQTITYLSKVLLTWCFAFRTEGDRVTRVS